MRTYREETETRFGSVLSSNPPVEGSSLFVIGKGVAIEIMPDQAVMAYPADRFCRETKATLALKSVLH